ncbi:hypothetical protein T439DRAFT_65351 [Meredithblackwellia eburnea MCA 4105]
MLILDGQIKHDQKAAKSIVAPGYTWCERNRLTRVGGECGDQGLVFTKSHQPSGLTVPRKSYQEVMNPTAPVPTLLAAAAAKKKAPTSDVRRRTALSSLPPATTSGPSGQPGATGDKIETTEEYLDRVELELNERVDKDVAVLVEGMAQLVGLSATQPAQQSTHYQQTQSSFSASVKTESMIRATHSLLSLSHTLKLLHLFNDTGTPARAREIRMRELVESIGETKEGLGLE